MGDPSPLYTLDGALSTIGFGKFQALLLAYGGLAWVAEAMEMMILSFIGGAVQLEWTLSPGEESLISTVVFAGMLVGAFAWGRISDVYGRKKGFLGVATVTAVAGLLSAFSPNYVSLVILRGIAGLGIGGMHIFTSWFLEFIPARNRGFWMIVFSSFWTLGTILEAGLGWIVMPKLGWRWLLTFSSLPSFIVLLFYWAIPESPRFLCMTGRTSEAQSILEKAAVINRTTTPAGTLPFDKTTYHDDQLPASETTYLLSSVRDEECESRVVFPSLFVLLSPKMLQTNLLMWFLYFGNTFSYYGIILLTSKLSGGQNTCKPDSPHLGKKHNADLYIDVFITSLAELPGLALSAFIVDRVGRKLSMVIMFVLGFVLLLPLVTHQNEIVTTTLLFGARTFISATFTVVCIYAPEVYPTSIRTTSVGIATAIGKIGGMICPLAAVGLVSACHQASGVILFEVMILLSGLCVLLSPFETKGRDLVDTVST